MACAIVADVEGRRLLIERQAPLVLPDAALPIHPYVLGVWLGTLSAVHKDKLVDQASRFIAITGYSLPSFALGLVLLMVFYGVLKLFPPGRWSLDTDLIVNGGGVSPRLSHRAARACTEPASEPAQRAALFLFLFLKVYFRQFIVHNPSRKPSQF